MNGLIKGAIVCVALAGCGSTVVNAKQDAKTWYNQTGAKEFTTLQNDLNTLSTNPSTNQVLFDDAMRDSKAALPQDKELKKDWLQLLTSLEHFSSAVATQDPLTPYSSQISSSINAMDYRLKTIYSGSLK